MQSQLHVRCNSHIGLGLTLKKRKNVLSLRKEMVGGRGFEPLTSTV